MNIGNINENDLDEFETLGLRYVNLQLRMSAILKNCTGGLSARDEMEIYELAMAQDELHTRRMEFIRY